MSLEDSFVVVRGNNNLQFNFLCFFAFLIFILFSSRHVQPHRSTFTLTDLMDIGLFLGFLISKRRVSNKYKIYDPSNLQRDQFLHAYTYLDYLPSRFKKINPVSYIYLSLSITY